MTCEQELRELIDFARCQGVRVDVQCDFVLWIAEGRTIIDKVSIVGLPRIDTLPMSALQAAETLRGYVGSVLPRHDQGAWEAVKLYKASNVRSIMAQV